MAATQVARNNSYPAFDEFLNLPSSPSLTPRLQPAKPAHNINNAPSTAPSAPAPAPAAFNMRKVGLDENQPPPPPGSSPEALFRYYLAVELRKAGTRPDEALLDRYVKNHFDSLFKNKQPAAGATVAAADTKQPIPAPKPAASISVAEPLALQRLPVPRKSPGTTQTPVAGPSSQPMTSTATEAGSPPELQDADSPSASAKSFSPLPTPPALNTVDEDEELDFSKGFKHGDSMFGESGLGAFAFDETNQLGDQVFRASALRSTADESVSIDPHMMQMDTATSLSMLDQQKQSGLPYTDVAAMSEDGMSEDEDSKDKLAGLLQQSGSASMSRASSVNPSHSRDVTPSTSAAAGSSSSSRVAAFPNDVKPDPEEYKKLSSKEKRQLRNKISARNFRTRRKEYIGHLEEQVADRDQIIEGLRLQLSQVTMENASLQEEMRVLKAKTISSNDVTKILEALQKNLSPINTTLVMPPPPTGPTAGGVDLSTGMAPLTPSAFLNFGDSSRPSTPTLSAGNGSGNVPASPRASSPRPSLLRRSSPSLIAQPNTKKDVGPQSSSFWGGIGNGNGQSFTSVC